MKNDSNNPDCHLCRQPITGEPFWMPVHVARNQPDARPYEPVCADCYAGYVKNKFGRGNTNPDEISIA
jgi:ribosomal protein L34E